MNKNIVIASALAFLFSISAFAEGAKVKVDGMVCAFCAQGIKKKFSENAAVEHCEVDLDKKEVSLTFKKGQKMSDDQIKNTIKDAGYTIHRLDRVN